MLKIELFNFPGLFLSSPRMYCENGLFMLRESWNYVHICSNILSGVILCVDMFSASITLILLNNCRYSLQYSLLQNQELYTAIHYITLSQRKSIFSNIKWKVAGETWYYAEYFMYCSVMFTITFHDISRKFGLLFGQCRM